MRPSEAQSLQPRRPFLPGINNALELEAIGQWRLQAPGGAACEMTIKGWGVAGEAACLTLPGRVRDFAHVSVLDGLLIFEDANHRELRRFKYIDSETLTDTEGENWKLDRLDPEPKAVSVPPDYWTRDFGETEDVFPHLPEWSVWLENERGLSIVDSHADATWLSKAILLGCLYGDLKMDGKLLRFAADQDGVLDETSRCPIEMVNLP